MKTLDKVNLNELARQFAEADKTTINNFAEQLVALDPKAADRVAAYLNWALQDLEVREKEAFQRSQEAKSSVDHILYKWRAK